MYLGEEYLNVFNSGLMVLYYCMGARKYFYTNFYTYIKKFPD